MTIRIWSIRYNQFHDQLLLTSSSDSRVILTNLTSISSEPYGHLVDDDDDGDDVKEKCVNYIGNMTADNSLVQLFTNLTFGETNASCTRF